MTFVAPLQQQGRIRGGLEHLQLQEPRCRFTLSPSGHAPLPDDLVQAALETGRDQSSVEARPIGRADRTQRCEAQHTHGEAERRAQKVLRRI